MQAVQRLGFICELSPEACELPIGQDLKDHLTVEEEILEIRRTGHERSQTTAVLTNVEGVGSRIRKFGVKGGADEGDIDRIVDEELDDEGDEMVADDAKKGSIPKRVVDVAKSEERKFIEKMKIFDVVKRDTTGGDG